MNRGEMVCVESLSLSVFKAGVLSRVRLRAYLYNLYNMYVFQRCMCLRVIHVRIPLLCAWHTSFGPRFLI